MHGENLVFAGAATFSMYALAALLPLLPAKQRDTHPHDWMTTDTDIACPDPNCGARFRITRTARRSFRHSRGDRGAAAARGAMTRATLAPATTSPACSRAAGSWPAVTVPIDAAAALADMDRFVDAGITTFDCADIYTGVEELIGRWLRTTTGAAAGVQVHTKYVPDLDRLATHSRADVARGIDRSLQRLGVDRIDLVQLHWWDYDAPGYIDAAALARRAARRGQDPAHRPDQLRSAATRRDRRRRCAGRLAPGAVLGARSPASSMASGMCVTVDWPAVLRRACRRVPVGAVAGRPGAGGRARESLAGQVSIDHRGVRRLGAVPAPAARAARHRRRVMGSALAPSRCAGFSISPASPASSSVRGMRGICLDRRRADRSTLTGADRDAIAAIHAEATGPAGEVYALERIKGGAHASIMRYTLNRPA